MLKHKAEGFTLIELLVMLVVASLLLASLVTVYVNSSQKYQQAIETAQLDQTLQGAMSLMVSDIQRAGFWKNAKSDAGTAGNHNPFMTNDITISGAGDCILFTYDRDGSGSLPSIGSGSDDKRYGFRLMNNAIQARPSGANYNCSAAANNWPDITDSNVITITQLSFVASNKTISVTGGASVIVRTITITLTGRLVSDSTVTRTLTEQVKVRNDKYTP